MRWGPQLRPLDPHCPSTSLQDTTEGTMNANDVASEGLGLISRLADEARSVAMVAGYVALPSSSGGPCSTWRARRGDGCRRSDRGRANRRREGTEQRRRFASLSTRAVGISACTERDCTITPSPCSGRALSSLPRSRPRVSRAAMATLHTSRAIELGCRLHIIGAVSRVSSGHTWWRSVAVLAGRTAEKPQLFRGRFGVQVPLLAFRDPRFFSVFSEVCPLAHGTGHNSIR